MAYAHLADYPTDIRERAARIRLACFDVDGTLTDGRLWLDAEGRELKAFHILDGMGLRLLEEHGVRVALVTARHSAVAEARGRELRISEIHVGIKDKRALLLELCAKQGITPAEAAAWIRRGRFCWMDLNLDDTADAQGAIESIGINPADVSPHHWRHVHNRLAAGQEPRSYTAEQHRAILLRRRVEP